MNEFAVVSEGVTDFHVLKNVLLGWFKDQNAEPFLKPYQPDPSADGQSTWQKHGTWENVIRYLKEKKYYAALEHADFLLVQIDSDMSEHPNFGVPQHDGGRPFEPPIMVQQIAAKLREVIGESDLKFYGERIIFAICVREIECWLLPLWDNQKASKCEGCTDTLNRALSRQNERCINPERKEPRHYDEISKGYKKRKTLLEDGRLNPSLAIFLNELERRCIVLSAE